MRALEESGLPEFQQEALRALGVNDADEALNHMASQLVQELRVLEHVLEHWADSDGKTLHDGFGRRAVAYTLSGIRERLDFAVNVDDGIFDPEEYVRSDERRPSQKSGVQAKPPEVPADKGLSLVQTPDAREATNDAIASLSKALVELEGFKGDALALADESPSAVQGFARANIEEREEAVRAAIMTAMEAVFFVADGSPRPQRLKPVTPIPDVGTSEQTAASA